MINAKKIRRFTQVLHQNDEHTNFYVNIPKKYEYLNKKALVFLDLGLVG